jgi:hypothetical protein
MARNPLNECIGLGARAKFQFQSFRKFTLIAGAPATLATVERADILYIDDDWENSEADLLPC